MNSIHYLIVPLLQGFEWFDESLQLSLKEAGLPQFTRPESMVMLHVQMDIVRPADIARSLRLTRQAVHATIAALVERGVFELVDDPADRRIRIVQLTNRGRSMRRDAQRIVEGLTAELSRRIGGSHVSALRTAFEQDWGGPCVFDVRRGAVLPTEGVAPPRLERRRRSSKTV